MAFAFAFALAIIPRPVDKPENRAGTEEAKPVDKKQREEETVWRWATKDAAATFTLFLVFIGGGQAWLFLRQLTIMREGIADATEAAKAATSQAKTAREALDVQQRPYVFITGSVDFLLYEDKERGELNPYFDYVVANYGRIPAIIQEARAGFVVAKIGTDVTPPLVKHNNPLFVTPIIKPSETRNPISCYAWIFDDLGYVESMPGDIEFTFPSDQLNGTSVIPVLKEHEDLFFRVIVKYRGLFTQGHETSACWCYDKAKGIFVGGGAATNKET